MAHQGGVPATRGLLLAALAGVSTTLELGLIYRALSRGRALITAPVGALGAAVAVSVGVIGGDPLDPLIVIGLVCALVGSAISTWSPCGARRMSQPAPERRPDLRRGRRQRRRDADAAARGRRSSPVLGHCGPAREHGALGGCSSPP